MRKPSKKWIEERTTRETERVLRRIVGGINLGKIKIKKLDWRASKRGQAVLKVEYEENEVE